MIGDQTIWIANKTGRFSVKSAIRILQGSETPCEAKWGWLWRTWVPYRIQTFLWLLFHRKLLTNAERFRRHLHSTPLCEICYEGEEDLDHLLRQCQNAKKVWQELEMEGVCCLSMNEALHVWLQQNLTGTHVDSNWPAKFSITLWNIWKWHCAIYFGTTERIPLEKGSFLCCKFKEILSALERDNQPSRTENRDTVERWIHWEPPEGGWMALNTDGAAKGSSGPAGAGGVLRDGKGEWIVGFSEYVGCCSTVKAELRVVLRGLKIAREMCIRKLWIRIDSKTVITWLTSNTPGLPEYYSLIQQCQQLLSWAGWEVHISHCFRKANQVATS